MSGDAVLRWCTGTRTEVVLGGGLYHNRRANDLYTVLLYIEIYKSTLVSILGISSIKSNDSL